MTTTVRVERSRTIQVFGAYTAETCTLAGERSLAENEDHAEARRGMVRDLDAALDAWEKDLRGRVKAAAEAAKAPAAPAPPPAPTPPPAGTTPPVDGITAATRHDVRKAALRLQELTGEPVNVAVPETEARGQTLLGELQAAIKDLEDRKARAAQPVGRDGPSWYDGHQNPAYKQGKDLAAGARRCDHGAKPGEGRRCDAPLSVGGFNYSINAHGRPLCKDHDPRNRGRA